MAVNNTQEGWDIDLSPLGTGY